MGFSATKATSFAGQNPTNPSPATLCSASAEPQRDFHSNRIPSLKYSPRKPGSVLDLLIFGSHVLNIRGMGGHVT